MLDLCSARYAIILTRAGIVLFALLVSGCGGSNDSDAPKIGGFEVDDSDTATSKTDAVASRPAQPLPKRSTTQRRAGGETVRSLPVNDGTTLF